ncbi:MAG: hypothetical protein QM730_13395 [Anaerolineales bacterium]
MSLFDPTRKEFYRTSKLNILYNALEFLAMLPFIVLAYEALTNKLHATPLIGGLFGGSFTLAIGMISIVLNQKLIVTRTGLEYHVGWSRMEVHWKDISSIGFRWGPLPRMEGFLVPATGQRTPFEQFIPLSIFADDWRDSELGNQIKKYAPHLLEKASIPVTD